MKYEKNLQKINKKFNNKSYLSQWLKQKAHNYSKFLNFNEYRWNKNNKLWYLIILFFKLNSLQAKKNRLSWYDYQKLTELQNLFEVWQKSNKDSKLFVFYRRNKEWIREKTFQNYELVDTSHISTISKTISDNKNSNMLKKRIKMFQSWEGNYNSYWLGRFINMFIRQGKKSFITKQVYKTLLIYKLIYDRLPHLFLLETLEQIRPYIFTLINIVKKRGRILLVPKMTTETIIYHVAFQWLIKHIKNNIKGKEIIKTPIYNKLLFELILIKKQANKHSLIKKRNAYLIEIIKLQKKVRYNWHAR